MEKYFKGRIMYLNSAEISSRLISDLRLGLPIILNNRNVNYVAIAIETLQQKRLTEVLNVAEEESLEIAITNRRAEVLKARLYNEQVTRLKMEKNITLNFLQATADPAQDLNFPYKGPFNSIRGGESIFAKIAIDLCKKARLLPAALLVKVSKETKILLVQNQVSHASTDSLSKQSYHSDLLSNFSSAKLPISNKTEIELKVFRNLAELSEHYAIVFGDPSKLDSCITRIHSACFTGDLLDSKKCDCGEQFRAAISSLKEHGKGVLLYMNQEGRGIGLANKMRAYHLQNIGFDTVEANHRLGFEDDERDLEIAAQILKALNLNKIELMTNNPRKIELLTKHGICVTGRIPLITKANPKNKDYLYTKATKSGHLL